MKVIDQNHEEQTREEIDSYLPFNALCKRYKAAFINNDFLSFLYNALKDKKEYIKEITKLLDLTRKEKEYFNLLLLDLTSIQIAYIFNVHTSTTKFHLAKIYRKTEMKFRVKYLYINRKILISIFFSLYELFQNCDSKIKYQFINNEITFKQFIEATNIAVYKFDQNIFNQIKKEMNIQNPAPTDNKGLLLPTGKTTV